ncbi:MAG: hypothetical protein IIC61_12630, partial [Proteobacteria bacterium]|nr:hypothetical protein [Pseudomonadota bacterium]
YLRVWLLRGDLLVARIRCHDVVEEQGKGARRLAIAGSTVPRKLMLDTLVHQESEQRIRIAGPVRGIAAAWPEK